jgi:hypothetical protein
MVHYTVSPCTRSNSVRHGLNSSQKTAKHSFTQRVDRVMGRFGDGKEDDQRLLIVYWLHINAFIHLMNFFTYCYHHVTCELCCVLYFTD